MKGVILALVLALLTAALAWGFALAAPPLGLDPWMGVAIAVIAGASPRRIRSMTVNVARATPDGPLAVRWIVQAAEGKHRLRCYCDIFTTQVLGAERLA